MHKDTYNDMAVPLDLRNSKHFGTHVVALAVASLPTFHCPDSVLINSSCWGSYVRHSDILLILPLFVNVSCPFRFPKFHEFSACLRHPLSTNLYKWQISSNFNVFPLRVSRGRTPIISNQLSLPPCCGFFSPACTRELPAWMVARLLSLQLQKTCQRHPKWAIVACSHNGEACTVG